MQGGQKNLTAQDSEIDGYESATPGRENEKEETKDDESSSILSRISGIFSFSKSEDDNKWQEFPWEKIIIKTDVIKKWSKVDTKYINQLHANFDTESGKFTNMDVSITPR